LKSGHYNPPACYNSNNHPPIPFDSTPSSYGEYSPLPYAQPFVHFPPSPTLTSTHVVDDSYIYDRTPIVVAENDCALPQRGCPGRTYIRVERPLTHKPVAAGNHVHPSAKRFSDCNSTPPPPSALFPPLCNDETSSEESDGALPTPPEYHLSLPEGPSLLCQPLCKPDHHDARCPGQQPSSHLSNPNDFLPHSPSPPCAARRASLNTISRLARGTTFASALDSSCLGGF